MIGGIAWGMSVKRTVAGLRARHLPDSTLKERDIAKRIRVHAKLHPRISPPLRLLAPGAIDVGVEHAIPQRFPADSPDLIQHLVAAFECADLLDRSIHLPQADLPDRQWFGQIAENQCRVAHSLVMERFPPLRAGPAAIAVGRRFLAGAAGIGSDQDR